MPRRGQGLSFNDGRELCLVWVRRRDDGTPYAPRPMVQLVECAQPIQLASAYGGLVLFQLGCICPVVLPSREYALTTVAADDLTWPVPRLPSIGVVQTEYGRDRDKTSHSSDIGAMPAAHLRAIVWCKPKLREQTPQAPVPIVAMLTAAEFRAPQATGPSMADLLFNGCGVRAPTVEVMDGDQPQLGFTVTCATFAMALAIFHAHGVVAEVGDVTKNFVAKDFEKIVAEYCDMMVADNLKRNYNGWKQDMDSDPRKGEPRRDKLNWPMNFLPAPIQKWIRENDDFPAYTMESIAFLICEACDPEESRRLVDSMPQPMRCYIQNERILAGERDGDERVATMERLREEVATHVKTLESFKPPPVGAVDADVTPCEGDMRLRAVMGCPQTRALIEREIDMKSSEIEIFAQVHDAAEKKCKGRQKPPDVQHLTKAQERQLVACLYARAVYHGTDQNLLQVAQTFAWVYFLHGKIGRFIGPYNMSDSKDYFRQLSSKPGAKTLEYPLRSFRGSRAITVPSGEKAYKAQPNRRVRRKMCPFNGHAQTIRCVEEGEEGEDEERRGEEAILCDVDPQEYM